MFSLLSDKLDEAFRRLRGQSKISEGNIADALKDIRLALLEADVDYRVARDFINIVKERAIGEKVLKTVKPGEQIVKIFRDELATLLGGDEKGLNLEPPGRILVVGLNGAGKTTTCAKLALRLKKDGHKPVLIACDLVRPAAVDQLVTLGKQVGVGVISPEVGEKDAVKAVRAALKRVEQTEHDVVIIDTAGRQEVDAELIEEIRRVSREVKPQEALLVADAATGQQAVKVAHAFQEAVGLSGIILTKLDGDARGGAALSMRAVTGCPIKYIGEGEKPDMFGAFVPQRMADRILGMGDIVGLVEKAAEKIDQDSAMHGISRMMSGEFNFEDFLSQMRMMQKLGPLEGLLGLLPGFNKIRKQLPQEALDPKRLKHTEAIVLSMTKAERANDKLLIPSRRRRIAKGAGVSEIEVNRFIKNFRQMKEMMGGKGKGGSLMQAMKQGMKDMPPMPTDGEMPDLSSMMNGGFPGLEQLMHSKPPRRNPGLNSAGGFGGFFRKR